MSILQLIVKTHSGPPLTLSVAATDVRISVRSRPCGVAPAHLDVCLRYRAFLVAAYRPPTVPFNASCLGGTCIHSQPHVRPIRFQERRQSYNMREASWAAPRAAPTQIGKHSPHTLAIPQQTRESCISIIDYILRSSLGVAWQPSRMRL